MLHGKQLLTILVVCGSLSAIIVVYFTDTFTNNNYANVLPRNVSQCNRVGFAIPTTGNGLGNHLFYYAAVMHVAWLTGRRPCVWTQPRVRVPKRLEEVFDLDIKHINVDTFGCPFHTFKHDGVYNYDRRVESLVDVSANESLWIRGSFCSWKYTHPIASELRQQLRFRQELTEFVADFLATNVPPGWTTLEYVRVGVHVRRGDFLGAWARSKGFTVANERYLQRAMNYFVERFPRVQFIVASNDIKWCQKHVTLSMFNNTNVNITFSVKHNTGQDLALLASCDHTVMTTGTYSWWSAWLANGTTVYYANFPQRGSWLNTQIRSHEFFRLDWIAIYD